MQRTGLYILRVLSAWLLLKLAQSFLKDAENLLRASAQGTTIGEEATSETENRSGEGDRNGDTH